MRTRDCARGKAMRTQSRSACSSIAQATRDGAMTNTLPPQVLPPQVLPRKNIFCVRSRPAARMTDI
jgi:hypothetical protein